MSLTPHIDDLLELRHRAHALGLASHHRVTSAMSGLYASVFHGQGMDFEETREYHEGDEIRNMDWRVTARTGVPHLKVYREERERAVMLCIDVGPHMRFGTRGTFKSVQAARAAALLGWAATSVHDRVGGLVYGDPDRGVHLYRPSRERRSFWRLLRTLTESRASTEAPVDPLPATLEKLVYLTPPGGLVFVIGDFGHTGEAFERGLGRLRQRHDVVLLPIDDPADYTLPAMGQVTFRTRDGARVQVDTDSTQGRERYRAAWVEQRQRLETLTTRLGVTLVPVATDAGIHETLAAGLRRLARRQVVR